MTLFFLIVFGIYFSLLLFLMVGWNKAMKKPSWESVKEFYSISIIVPFRNETTVIQKLIETLKSQDYPTSKFEVILVDDYSEDDSLEIVKRLIANSPTIKVISTIQKGKKSAITMAIAVAKGDIIVTTDADCSIPLQWLRHINSDFQRTGVKMLVGGVSIRQNSSFFSILQSLEFSSLIGTAAATITLGFPTLCNGANLAYRKEAFYAVSGYDGNIHVSSGDDEFLMRKIFKKFGGNSIDFMNERESVVMTEPQSSLRCFLSQRIRWASKWKYNSSKYTKLLAVFILVFQFSFFTLLITLLFYKSLVFLLLVIVKIIAEAFFLWKVSKFLQQKFSMLSFFVLQLVYPFYAMTVGLLSTFIPVFWKGRTIQ